MVVNWLCKTVGMMVAWTVQRILSAAHSAMRGGFMAARHAMEFIAQRSGKKFDADKSCVRRRRGAGAGACVWCAPR